MKWRITTWPEGFEVEADHQEAALVAGIERITTDVPLFLIDNKWANSTGECSLFVRRLRLVQTPKRTWIKCANDVWTFPDEDSMLAAIERYGLARPGSSTSRRRRGRSGTPDSTASTSTRP
jgi:hypothetical protein